VFYDAEDDTARAWDQAGALGVDLQTAALAAVAARRGVRLGCVLAVAERRGVAGSRLDAEALEAAGAAAGHAAAGALRTP
jgi:uridine phosphorylase